MNKTCVQKGEFEIPNRIITDGLFGTRQVESSKLRRQVGIVELTRSILNRPFAASSIQKIGARCCRNPGNQKWVVVFSLAR